MPLSPLYTDDTGDVIMEDRIKILGVEMDCLTAKEAMLEAMRFMENDSVDTIEILSRMKSGKNIRPALRWFFREKRRSWKRLTYRTE